MDHKCNYSGTKGNGSNDAYTGRHRGRQLRLWCCLGIFALAVGVKVIAPEYSGKISAEVLEVIEKDSDYRAVFAAVGSFVSGESSFEEAVQVIRGGGAAAQPAVAELPELSGAAEANLQAMYLRCAQAGEKRVQQAAAVRSGDFVYEAESGTLPDNVCIDPVELPFEYSRPVSGERTSDFGYRDHPIDNEYKFHYGVDFCAEEGDSILAFAAGHVAASGISETAGKYLIISHGGGWTTQYFHCSEVYATGGSPVERGEIVAAVGRTGAATGPHLHFELICDGVYHDPGLYLNEQG